MKCLVLRHLETEHLWESQSKKQQSQFMGYIRGTQAFQEEMQQETVICSRSGGLLTIKENPIQPINSIYRKQQKVLVQKKLWTSPLGVLQKAMDITLLVKFARGSKRKLTWTSLRGKHCRWFSPDSPPGWLTPSKASANIFNSRIFYMQDSATFFAKDFFTFILHVFSMTPLTRYLRLLEKSGLSIGTPSLQLTNLVSITSRFASDMV